MKKFISASLIGSVLLMSQVSCVGSFGLFNKLLDWNQGISDKFVNELIFIGLWIVPVYEIALLADLWIINAIEFWTGSSPIAMNEGDMEQQYAKGKDGKDYLITATKNKFVVEEVGNTENRAEMIYLPEDMSWTVVEGSKRIKLVEGVKDSEGKLTGEVQINLSEKSHLVYDLNQTSLAQLKQHLNADNTFFAMH